MGFCGLFPQAPPPLPTTPPPDWWIPWAGVRGRVGGRDPLPLGSSKRSRAHIHRLPPPCHSPLAPWEPIEDLKQQEADEWMYELQRMEGAACVASKDRALVELFAMGAPATSPARGGRTGNAQPPDDLPQTFSAQATFVQQGNANFSIFPFFYVIVFCFQAIF